MKVLVKDLPNRKDLIGKRFNMRRQGGKYHYDYQDKPLIRTFWGAQKYRKNGLNWIKWKWEPMSDALNFDYGYDEINLNVDLFCDSYLDILVR